VSQNLYNSLSVLDTLWRFAKKISENHPPPPKEKIRVCDFSYGAETAFYNRGGPFYCCKDFTHRKLYENSSIIWQLLFLVFLSHNYYRPPHPSPQTYSDLRGEGGGTKSAKIRKTHPYFSSANRTQKTMQSVAYITHERTSSTFFSISGFLSFRTQVFTARKLFHKIRTRGEKNPRLRAHSRRA